MNTATTSRLEYALHADGFYLEMPVKAVPVGNLSYGQAFTLSRGNRSPHIFITYAGEGKVFVQPMAPGCPAYLVSADSRCYPEDRYFAEE